MLTEQNNVTQGC